MPMMTTIRCTRSTQLHSLQLYQPQLQKVHYQIHRSLFNCDNNMIWIVKGQDLLIILCDTILFLVSFCDVRCDLYSKLNVTEIQGKWKKIINNQYTGLCVLLLLSKDFFSQSKLLKNKIRLSYSMFQISAVLCLLLSLLMGLIKMWSDLM